MVSSLRQCRCNPLREVRCSGRRNPLCSPLRLPIARARVERSNKCRNPSPPVAGCTRGFASARTWSCSGVHEIGSVALAGS
ncbi:hypothetical protein DLE01_36980 [Streptomyces sp. FT05W]|nr:hypothetical protein DLE01_36980 [Streptomyces sp. FT05W]